MSTQTLQPLPPPGGKRKRYDTMVLLIVGIFAAYILTNGIMLYVSLHGPPLLVSQSYYEDSQLFSAEQSAEDASDALGWRVQAVTLSAAELTIRILDRNSRLVSGFSGTASAYRPNDMALDQDLALSEDVAMPGQYTAKFARPKSGQWQIHLQLRRGGDRLNHVFRVVTP